MSPRGCVKLPALFSLESDNVPVYSLLSYGLAVILGDHRSVTGRTGSEGQMEEKDNVRFPF